MVLSKHKSGGATFTPRLPDGQRPEYPSAVAICADTMTEYLRAGALTVLLTYFVYPLYSAVVSLLMDSNGWALDERAAFTVLTSVVHTGAYLLICGGIELMLGLGLWKRYRFKREPHQVPSPKLVATTLITAAVGQLIIGPTALYYVGFSSFRSFGMPSLNASLPGALAMFWDYSRARLFNDWFFYWAHRTFHCRALYARLHKQHHSYTGSTPIAAEFAGMPETILANVLPTIGGALFFGAHPLVFLVWLAVRLEQTYESHSGVCFKGSFLHKLGLTNGDKCADHDHHHALNQGNFAPYWMDYLFGTMDSYVASGGAEGYCQRWQGPDAHRK